MTGRKGRVVSNDAGDIQYEKRSEAMVSLEVINVTEKKRFMDLEKVIEFEIAVFVSFLVLLLKD